VTKSPPWSDCWDVLPKVSRSFAFVIRWLPRGVDDAVMIAYLLCRIADTLEDSVRALDDKRRWLKRFADTLDEGTPEIPDSGYREDYRCLMTRVPQVLACYRSLPEKPRAILRTRVREMCDGMSQWADRKVVTLEDQNDYCYYVAGLVGLLLTDLFHAYGKISDSDHKALTPLAVPFGLALQKVNILRDLREDVLEDRCYWPSAVLEKHGLDFDTVLKPENIQKALAAMEDLVEDHWQYLGAALKYLTLLPARAFRLRVFCAIPLFMAVATVRRCEGNPDVFLAPKPVKIPRPWARGILLRSMSLGSFNSFLKSWYRRWQTGTLDRPSPWRAVSCLLP
jgi:farnesyl-diphosphate farnesyltransferase